MHDDEKLDLFNENMIYYFNDEVWDHCLKCGEHWYGIVPSCKCSERSYQIKKIGMPFLTKKERIELGRKIIREGEVGGPHPPLRDSH
jgi:hypothetical protein